MEPSREHGGGDGTDDRHDANGSPAADHTVHMRYASSEHTPTQPRSAATTQRTSVLTSEAGHNPHAVPTETPSVTTAGGPRASKHRPPSMHLTQAHGGDEWAHHDDHTSAVSERMDMMREETETSKGHVAAHGTQGQGDVNTMSPSPAVTTAHHDGPTHATQGHAAQAMVPVSPAGGDGGGGNGTEAPALDGVQVATEMRFRIRVYQSLTSLTGLITTTSTFMFGQARNGAPFAEYQTFASLNLVLASTVLIGVMYGTSVVVLQKNKAGLCVSRKQYRAAILGWHEGRDRRHRAVLSIVLSLPCVLMSSSFFLLSTSEVRLENWIASGVLFCGAVFVIYVILSMEHEFQRVEDSDVTPVASTFAWLRADNRTAEVEDEELETWLGTSDPCVQLAKQHAHHHHHHNGGRGGSRTPSPCTTPTRRTKDAIETEQGARDDDGSHNHDDGDGPFSRYPEGQTAPLTDPPTPTTPTSHNVGRAGVGVGIRDVDTESLDAEEADRVMATVTIPQSIRHILRLTTVSVLMVLITRVMFAEARDALLVAEFQRVGIGNMMVSVLTHTANVYASAVLILQQHMVNLRISTKRYRSAVRGWERLAAQRKRATTIISYSVPMILFAAAFYMLGGQVVNPGSYSAFGMLIGIATKTWWDIFSMAREFRKADALTLKSVKHLLVWTKYIPKINLFNDYRPPDARPHRQTSDEEYAVALEAEANWSNPTAAAGGPYRTARKREQQQHRQGSEDECTSTSTAVNVHPSDVSEGVSLASPSTRTMKHRRSMKV
eukprot:m.25506 g.25506  ORF g.25506 m.25506 type:complete len:777 (+) comp4243_c0_seq2:283-2613(+)